MLKSNIENFWYRVNNYLKVLNSFTTSNKQLMVVLYLLTLPVQNKAAPHQRQHPSHQERQALQRQI